MALPALAGLRRRLPGDAPDRGRAPVRCARCFDMVAGIDEVTRVPAGRAWHPSDLRVEAAVSPRPVPTSPSSSPTRSGSAWVVAPRRHPRALGLRGRPPRRALLTRAVPQAARRGMHQADYYRASSPALGMSSRCPSLRRVVRARRGARRARAALLAAARRAAGRAARRPGARRRVRPARSSGRRERFAELALELHARARRDRRCSSGAEATAKPAARSAGACRPAALPGSSSIWSGRPTCRCSPA